MAGLDAVAAFTDEDLAERFLQALGDPAMVLLATRTRDMLIELLEDVQSAGYVLVAFDPCPRPVLVPVQTVLRDVRRIPDGMTAPRHQRQPRPGNLPHRHQSRHEPRRQQKHSDRFEAREIPKTFWPCSGSAGIVRIPPPS